MSKKNSNSYNILPAVSQPKIDCNSLSLPKTVNPGTVSTPQGALSLPKTFIESQQTEQSSNTLLPKTVNTATKSQEPSKKLVNKSVLTKQKLGDAQATAGITCRVVGVDNTIIVETDKDVYINNYENITEQKYINNISGGLQVGEITGSSFSSLVNNATKLGFDTDSGFEVSDLGSGLAKIGMNSTFKCWEVNGAPGLVASGLDTVNFVAGSGVTITSCNTSVPKTLTISASGGATPTVSGTMYGCTNGYGEVGLGYNAGLSGGFCYVMIGDDAGSGMSQACNIAVGHRAMMCGAAGGGNIAIGMDAMYGSCTGFGYNNIAIGDSAMLCHKNGLCNIAIGKSAMELNCCGRENVAIGVQALQNNTCGSYNVAVGGLSQYSNYGADGNFNTSIGYYSLSLNSTGANNVAVGYGSLTYGCGNSNIGVGVKAGCSITTGENNTVIGSLFGSPGLVCTVLIGAGTCERIKVDNNGLCINGAAYSPTVNLDAYCSFKVGNGLVNATGLNNVAIGQNALLSSTNSLSNVALGYGAMQKTNGGPLGSDGGWNVAIGCKTLYCNTTGLENIAIGSTAMYCNLRGNYNVAIGPRCALYGNYCGCSNIAIGQATLTSNANGSCNIAVGYLSLSCIVNGNHNVALGRRAGAILLYGCHNVAIGCHAIGGYGSSHCGCWNVAVGSAALCTVCGHFNTAVGAVALSGNKTGSCNIGIGYLANVAYPKIGSGSCAFNNIGIGDYTLYCTANGSCNIAIGSNALRKHESGYFNIAIGVRALCSNGTGNHNIAIGLDAAGNTTGDCNIAIGALTLTSNTSGIENIAIGTCAGSNNTTGVNNIFIGCSSLGATATSSNTITLGNSITACIRAQVTTISALSDLRDKTAVENLPLGLQFILDLRPVKFTWNMRDGGKVGVEDSGFIAQDVAALEDQAGVTHWLDMVGRENPDKLEVKPGKLIPILVKAIQDLNDKLLIESSKISQLEQEIAALKSSM